MALLESPNVLEGPWWRFLLSAGDTAVLHVDLVQQRDVLHEALTWLDETDLARYHRFLYPQPAFRFALCRSAVRSILCGYLGCDNRDLSFELSPFEKPFALVAGKAVMVEFSVSHSAEHGLIAVAPNGRVGVDVEERRCRKLSDLIEIAMAPHERAYLKGLEETEKQRQFLRFWTLKEAMLKALGTGLYFDISRLEVPSALWDSKTVAEFSLPDSEHVVWTLADISNEDFVAALAREKT